jgi:hypothetical protein
MAKDVVVEDMGGGEIDDDVTEGREQIITADDLLSEDALDVVYIALPAPWKGGIRARPLTNAEFREVVRDNTTRRRDKKGRVLSSDIDADGTDKDMIARCLVEPALTRAQVDTLFLKKAALCNAILVALNKLNGFTDGDEGEAVEQAEAEFRA